MTHDRYEQGHRDGMHTRGGENSKLYLVNRSWPEIKTSERSCPSAREREVIAALKGRVRFSKNLRTTNDELGGLQ
jgi:hypothetical protein